MRSVVFFLLLIILLSGCAENELNLFNPANNSFSQQKITLDKRPTVFCYLSPTCPLCLKQTHTLQNSINKYSSKVSFCVIIPSQQLPDEEIVKSSSLFKLTCPIFIDLDARFCKQKKASTTPQYQLYYNKQKLYDGKLDNTYKAINMPSFDDKYINYLNDALDSLMRNKKIATPSTTPVGCYIE